MSTRRSAFTLVELLVVITIIGLLMAMMFPALQGVMAAVNRQACANKLREVANACEIRASNDPPRYPSLVDKGGTSGRDKQRSPVPWTAQVLQYLGEKPLGDTWTHPSQGKSYVVARVPAFICSEDSTTYELDQPLSYVINAGAIEDAIKPNPANGIAFSRFLQPRATDRADIQKSLAATILLTENLQAGNWGDRRRNAGDEPAPYDGHNPASAREAQQFIGFVWNGLGINQGDDGVDFDIPAEAPSPKWARPSSGHYGGVNIALCAGSVRFLDQRIEQHVFQYLCVTKPANATGKALDPRVKNMVSAGDF